MKVTINCAGGTLEAEHIRTYERADAGAPLDGDSALTFRGMAAAILAALPQASAAAVFSACSHTQLLMLARIGKRWYDVSGQPAEITRAKESNQ